MQKQSIILFVLLLPLLAMGALDHVIISEVCLLPSEREFIKLSNPTNAAVDLSDYYLTDATEPTMGQYYYNLPGDADYYSGSKDFIVRFPDGYTLDANTSILISVPTKSAFNDNYGEMPDLSIKEDFRQAGSLATTIGGAPYYFDDYKETLVLFYWDGSSATVQDVDYIIWGGTDFGVDKSGISGYNNDTPVASQDYIPWHAATQMHNIGQKLKRNSDEGTETQSGGNGITGHDETSENLSQTWIAVSVGNTKPEITSVTLSPTNPTTEDDITITATITDDGLVDLVQLSYSFGSTNETVDMLNTEGDSYSTKISSFGTVGVLYYTIEATDNSGLVTTSLTYSKSITEPEEELTIASIRENWGDYDGETVTLRGVVTIGSNIIITTRTSAYFQDQSGKGLNLYDGSITALEQGDSIEVTGSLTEFNGVYELTDWTSSIEVLAKNVPITTVNKLDIIEIINDLADWEGSYVEVSGAVADRSNPTSTNTGCNVTIEDETGRATVRIWNTTGVIYDALGNLVNEETDSLLEVGNRVTLRGVVGIYSDSPQILLGYASDVEAYIEGEAGFGNTLLTVAPYPFVPKLGEVIQYSYEYPANCRVILRVYDLSGRFITTLEDSYYAVTWKKQSTWNGRNELDQLLPPGNYIFHLQTTNRSTGKTESDIAPVVIGVKF